MDRGLELGTAFVPPISGGLVVLCFFLLPENTAAMIALLLSVPIVAGNTWLLFWLYKRF